MRPARQTRATRYLHKQSENLYRSWLLFIHTYSITWVPFYMYSHLFVMLRIYNNQLHSVKSRLMLFAKALCQFVNSKIVHYIIVPSSHSLSTTKLPVFSTTAPEAMQLESALLSCVVLHTMASFLLRSYSPFSDLKRLAGQLKNIAIL